MKVTDEGVPLEDLIDVVKASVIRAGISRISKARDFQVASVQLILKTVASTTAGGSLDFRVPFIGMKLKLGARVTKKDTHTIDMTLAPPEDAGRQVRGGEDVEEALVDAIAAIRAVTLKAAAGRAIPGSCRKAPSTSPSPSPRRVPSRSESTGSCPTN
jgi:hypothetical protein